jgi:aspartate 1-decarboxylase
MLRTMITSKVHRATVTQADLHGVGSRVMPGSGLVRGDSVAS